jgi:hypothetical protein
MLKLYKVVRADGRTPEGFGKWPLPGSRGEVTLQPKLKNTLIKCKYGYHLLPEGGIREYIRGTYRSVRSPFVYLYEACYDPRGAIMHNDKCVVSEAGLTKKIPLMIDQVLPLIVSSKIKENIITPASKTVLGLICRNLSLSYSNNEKDKTTRAIQLLLEIGDVDMVTKDFITALGLLDPNTKELPLDVLYGIRENNVVDDILRRSIRAAEGR